jgi:hypothetical protein
VTFCTLEDPSAKPLLVAEQCLTDFPLARSFFTDLIRKTENLSMSASALADKVRERFNPMLKSRKEESLTLLLGNKVVMDAKAGFAEYITRFRDHLEKAEMPADMSASILFRAGMITALRDRCLLDRDGKPFLTLDALADHAAAEYRKLSEGVAAIPVLNAVLPSGSVRPAHKVASVRVRSQKPRGGSAAPSAAAGGSAGPSAAVAMSGRKQPRGDGGWQSVPSKARRNELRNQPSAPLAFKPRFNVDLGWLTNAQQRAFMDEQRCFRCGKRPTERGGHPLIKDACSLRESDMHAAMARFRNARGDPGAGPSPR